MVEALGLANPKLSKYVVNDNARNQKLAVKMSAYLEQYLCDNHTMQLGVRDAMKEVNVSSQGKSSSGANMSDVLKKCQNLGAYLHRSHIGVQELKKACQDKNICYIKIVLPNDTRWNSQFRNLVSVVRLVREGDNFSEDWLDKVLTVSKFKLAERASLLLAWIEDLTKVWEVEKVPSMNRVIDQLYSLDQKLKDFIEDVDSCT